MLPNSSMHVWRMSTWLANPVMVRHLISPEWLEEMSYDSDSKGDECHPGPHMRMLQPGRGALWRSLLPLHRERLRSVKAEASKQRWHTGFVRSSAVAMAI